MIHAIFDLGESLTRLDDKLLVEHPEGGRFREVYRSSHPVQNTSGQKRCALTHIYFSLGPGEVSRFHKVESDEVWNLYEGEIILYVWDDTAQLLMTYELSAANRTYCVVVEAGKWQAAIAKDSQVLVGCSVAPGFEFADFTLIDPGSDVADRILKKSPELSSLITNKTITCKGCFL